MHPSIIENKSGGLMPKDSAQTGRYFHPRSLVVASPFPSQARSPSGKRIIALMSLAYVLQGSSRWSGIEPNG